MSENFWARKNITEKYKLLSLFKSVLNLEALDEAGIKRILNYFALADLNPLVLASEILVKKSIHLLVEYAHCVTLGKCVKVDQVITCDTDCQIGD